MKRRWWTIARVLLPMALCLAASCNKSSQATGIIVKVNSDLNVPRDINQVVIVADTSGGMEVYRHTFDLGVGQGRVPLPVEDGLFPLDDAAAPVHITAIGQLDGTALVSRSATLSFVKGRKVLLELDLLAVCENVPCSQADWTCTSSGQCEPDTVNSADLPTFTDGVRGTSDAGFDGARADAPARDGALVDLPASARDLGSDLPAAVVDVSQDLGGDVAAGNSDLPDMAAPDRASSDGASDLPGVPGDGPTPDAAVIDVPATPRDSGGDVPVPAVDVPQDLGADVAAGDTEALDMAAADGEFGDGASDLLPGCDNACQTFYYDGDGDGFGVALLSRCLCEPSAPYTATIAGDCDDGRSQHHHLRGRRH